MNGNSEIEFGSKTIVPRMLTWAIGAFAALGCILLAAAWLFKSVEWGFFGISFLLIVFVVKSRMNMSVSFRAGNEALHVTFKRGSTILEQNDYPWRDMAACELVIYCDENDLLPDEETRVGGLTPPSVDDKPMAHYRCRVIFRGRPVCLFCSLHEQDAALLRDMILLHEAEFAS